MNKPKSRVLNSHGFSLIEVLIVSVIGLFVLEAAYLLYMGALRLFKDVKASSETVETSVPSMELVARYFDRWGVNVATGGANCAAYPPVNGKCITVTEGTPCDEVVFWGNLYGTGFVENVAGGTATLVSCRLSTSAGQNCYYLWSNDVIMNDLDGGQLVPLTLNNNLSVNNADCSALTAASPTNATVSATLTPAGVHAGAVDKNAQTGDFIHRAPHRVRLYCAQNASDANRLWLYVDLTDTATDCNANESAAAVAPVDSFQVQLLPSGCDPASGACNAASVTAVFRSQSRKYGGGFDTHTVTRILGRSTP